MTLYELHAFKEGEPFCKVKKVHELFDYSVIQMLNLNSAFSTDCHEKVAMFDEKMIYIWDVKNRKIKTLYDHNVKGIYFFDDQYVYTLSLPSRDREGGLRLYEATGLLDGQEDSYLLTPAAIGCSTLIDFNRANARLAFQKSAEQIEVVPLLHRNSLNFLGMPNRSEVLATRTSNDKFTILNKQRELVTWDITTGKMLLKKPLDLRIHGYSVAKFVGGNEIYTSHHYEAVLLMADEPEESYNIDRFY